MSDQYTIVDADTKFGNLVVQHVITSAPDKFGLMQTEAHWEVLMDGEVKHSSNDPEDLMRALGHYIVGLSYEQT